jgi:hypothetical protein
MDEDPMDEETSSHRLRWLMLALLVGGIVWVVRSRAVESVESGESGESAQDRSLPPAPVDEPQPVAAPAPAVVVEPGPAAGRPAPRARRSAAATLPAGSVAAGPDGSAPGPEFTVKAKAGSELFHGPDSPYFGRTKADLWFRTADDARAAGLTAWTPRRRAAG